MLQGFATFCALAGVSPADAAKTGTRATGVKFALPAVDSLSMVDYVSGTASASPRDEVPLSIGSPTSGSGALIVGDFKLIIGSVTYSFWQVCSSGTFIRLSTYVSAHSARLPVTAGPGVSQLDRWGSCTLRPDPAVRLRQ
eukprot:COSAG06_NODE_1984_length_7915_cov_3.829178_3_plen_140_part_00